MNKKVRFVTQGKRADIGEYTINRMLPNRYADAIGPFVFLDHVLPVRHRPDEPHKIPNGKAAHPHRGIATLTYILNGEADHLDSRGHHAIVRSGGAQWMKAGSGIIHDEVVNVDPQTNDLMIHAFQFWINLPSRQKAEPPEYLPVAAGEVPLYILSDQRGWLKVVVGEYEGLVSRIPGYSKQFLYHIHQESGTLFSLSTENELEYAAFLPLHNAMINDKEFKKGDLITFERREGAIEVINNSDVSIDIIIFGGEKYTEPIVFQGPFVMNSQEEIAEAYSDFHNGKYGRISYQ